ncbi:MAG: radical SAM family heme chaperone HemW [Bacteriovoracia bacterium]
MEKFKSLYIHFPYCETKCHYCDFYSLPEAKYSIAEKGSAYQAISSEVDFHLKSEDRKIEPLDTIFLGGGTPSLVPIERMGEILEKLPITPTTEVTIEANPSSISDEKAKGWRLHGINRVSIGAQALNDERLNWLGRVHGVDQTYRAIEAVTKAGIQRISIDYILGVPGQTESTIESELVDVLMKYPQISHVSAYLLTLKESNSRFTELPSEEIQLAHLRKAREVLFGIGFYQYEISNYSKPGFEARHNENYWLGGAYLGIGPSAHSFWQKKKTRTKNWGSLHRYVQEIFDKKDPVEWEESIGIQEERLEFAMLRLRRRDGIEYQDFESRFGGFSEKTSAKAKALEEAGFLSLKGGKIRLVNDGFFLSDQIVKELF